MDHKCNDKLQNHYSTISTENLLSELNERNNKLQIKQIMIQNDINMNEFN